MPSPTPRRTTSRRRSPRCSSVRSMRRSCTPRTCGRPGPASRESRSPRPNRRSTSIRSARPRPRPPPRPRRRSSTWCSPTRASRRWPTPASVRRPPEPQGGVPLPLLVPAALGLALLVLPLLGLVIRAPWSDLLPRLTEPVVGQALRLSLFSATLTTLVSIVLGVPLAWVLARSRIRGRSVLRALVTVPLVLPPVVGGVALFLVLGRQGILGRWLYEATGFALPFTTAAVVIAETFVAMPFLVISVEGALRAADARFEDAAATLGADRWTTFRRVTLPLVSPGVAAGAVLCWARALGGSVRPSPSPATSRGRRRRCPSPSTSRCRATRRPRSCSRSCCSPSRWPPCCCCAPAGSAGPPPRHEPHRVDRRAPRRAAGRAGPGGRRRRGARPPRPERGGQVHPAARARGPAAARRRPGERRRRRLGRARRRRPPGSARAPGGHGVPGLP